MLAACTSETRCIGRSRGSLLSHSRIRPALLASRRTWSCRSPRRRRLSGRTRTAPWKDMARRRSFLAPALGGIWDRALLGLSTFDWKLAFSADSVVLPQVHVQEVFVNVLVEFLVEANDVVGEVEGSSAEFWVVVVNQQQSFRNRWTFQTRQLWSACFPRFWTLRPVRRSSSSSWKKSFQFLRKRVNLRFVLPLIRFRNRLSRP